MRQLVQLQDQIKQFEDENCQLVAIFREEKEGLDGLAKSKTKSGATFPLAIDTPADATKAYSRDAFHTYVIGPEGKVLVDIPGTKMKRPAPKKILAALEGAKQPVGAN